MRGLVKGVIVHDDVQDSWEHTSWVLPEIISMVRNEVGFIKAHSIIIWKVALADCKYGPGIITF